MHYLLPGTIYFMVQCVVYHLLYMLTYPGVTTMEAVTPFSSPKVKKLHIRKVRYKHTPPLPTKVGT